MKKLPTLFLSLFLFTSFCVFNDLNSATSRKYMATNNAANNVTAATGKVLQGAGIGTASAFSTATYPSTATGTGTILRADGTNWAATTATYPATTTINQILYSSSANVVAGLTTANSAFLTTTSGGVPQLATSPSASGTITGGTGLTATTGNVAITSGNLTLPATTATVGKITIAGSNYIQNFGGNIFMGNSAGNTTLSGTTNVGIGSTSCASLTVGSSNIAIGNATLNALQTGSGNTCIGYNSMTAATNSYNTCVGQESLFAMLGGSNNVAMGVYAGHNMTTATNNTCLGYYSMNQLVSGTLNAALGYNAAANLTTNDSNNIMLGNIGTAGDNGKIKIGTNGTQTTCFISGIRGVTTANADAVAVLVDSVGQLGTVSSSIRYKENVEDMGNASSGILNLRPVTFDFIDRPSHKKQVGLIAEEVLEVMPDLVVYNIDGEVESVKYHELPVLLLNEIKKLSKRIEELESR